MIPERKIDPNVTVHALSSGMALCGFTNKIPKHWPPGHEWTGKDDIKHINCSACLAVLNKQTG